MAKPLPLEIIEKLPKTDLHGHLDGSLRLATILDLAEKQKVELPADDEDGLRKAMHLGQNCGSLVEYLKAFDVTLAVMQTEDALYRASPTSSPRTPPPRTSGTWRCATRRCSTRAAGLQAHERRRGGPRGPARRAAQFGHRVERHRLRHPQHVPRDARSRWPSSRSPTRTAASSASTSPAPSTTTPRRTTSAAFQLVRDNNINVHHPRGRGVRPRVDRAGDPLCGAHRIGHGCRLREDGDLLHYVNDHRIPLECCPSSNVQTGAIRDLASHPLKLYFDLGLRVTVNTDNRLITDTTVSQGAVALPHADGPHARGPEADHLAGFKSAFLPFHVKQQYLRKVSEELRAFTEDGPSIAPPAAKAKEAAQA